MQNLTPHRTARISACRVDLLTSGIDLAGMDDATSAAFVDEHLEYFQSMLGDDTPAELILALVEHERRLSERAGRDAGIRPLAHATEGEFDADERRERAERRRQAMAHMTLDELFAVAHELRRQSAEVIEQLELVQEQFEALHH
jgi:hypothetical protein